MLEKNFSYITQLIQEARNKAFRSVNQELISLYWKVGDYVSQQIEQNNWGDGTVEELSKFILAKYPTMRGFTRRGLYRMKQFYDTYKNVEIVSSLMTQISWTHHINILSKTKSIEEKEFYIRLAISERLSVRELRRQIDTAVFERTIISNKKGLSVSSNLPTDIAAHFKDVYVLNSLTCQTIFQKKTLKKECSNTSKRSSLKWGGTSLLLGKSIGCKLGQKTFLSICSFSTVNSVALSRSN